MSLDFNVIEFLKEEIKSENQVVKLDALKNINLVANALGPQKTVSELLPFFSQAVMEEPLCDDEEFLFNMAKQYFVLADYISGQYHLLMAPLEHLAAQEETVIREQAILSLCGIVDKKPALSQEYLVPILLRLAAKTDFFTSRVSACALFPTAYKHCNEDQKAPLRTAYATLSADDTPMVRRAAAHKMKDFVAVCDKAGLIQELLQPYKQLCKEDTQETIRVACVHTTMVIAKKFNSEENKQHTVSVMKEFAEDRSWRVRLTVARNFDEICDAYGPELTASHLMQPFVGLLKDNEQEVRKEAVKVLIQCLNTTDRDRPIFSNEQLQEHILPQFQSLSLDAGQPVRAALALVLGPVAKCVGRDVTQQQLLSLISDLMKDEFQDVRLNIVSHAGAICEVLGVDGLVHSLLHTIQSLIMDNHWRIRQSVVEQVPQLAKLCGVDMFQSKLESLFLSSLRDSVQAVRKAATDNLKTIAETFGAQWAVQHLLPKIVEQYSQSAAYANRVTTLFAISPVAEVLSPDQAAQAVIPLFVKALKDNVPNVRFSACRALCNLGEKKKFGAAALALVKPALQECEKDTDVDVQYFAGRALAACNS